MLSDFKLVLGAKYWNLKSRYVNHTRIKCVMEFFEVPISSALRYGLHPGRFQPETRLRARARLCVYRNAHNNREMLPCNPLIVCYCL